MDQTVGGRSWVLRCVLPILVIHICGGVVGLLSGVAECARQSGPTFLRRLRHRAITETELYTFDRNAKAISREHGHHGVGARPDISRAAANEGHSISSYGCDGFAWGLIRDQCRSCHAVS